MGDFKTTYQESNFATRYGIFWARELPGFTLLQCQERIAVSCGEKNSKSIKVLHLYFGSHISAFYKVKYPMCINHLCLQDYVSGMSVFEPNIINTVVKTEYFLPMPFTRIFDHMH